jgi:23S rRNA (adenine2030-N6)-methyltransferase
MLSYQHAYHAGNPADVQKHDALARLIVALTQKPRPITYMETHAGRGLYDLTSAEARKTGEAAHGVLKADPAGPYGDALTWVRALYGPNSYPGSPLVARMHLREEDRLHLMELHPGEHAELKKVMAAEGVAIHHRDGFEGVLAISPPSPRKGLVLIDPSYEVKSDYEAVPAFVKKLLARWAEATVLIWYPVLPEGRHKALLNGLKGLDTQVWEVPVDLGRDRGMTGSGMVGVNLPWGFRLDPQG